MNSPYPFPTEEDFKQAMLKTNIIVRDTEGPHSIAKDQQVGHLEVCIYRKKIDSLYQV